MINTTILAMDQSQSNFTPAFNKVLEYISIAALGIALLNEICLLVYIIIKSLVLLVIYLITKCKESRNKKKVKPEVKVKRSLALRPSEIDPEFNKISYNDYLKEKNRSVPIKRTQATVPIQDQLINNRLSVKPIMPGKKGSVLVNDRPQRFVFKKR